MKKTALILITVFFLSAICFAQPASTTTSLPDPAQEITKRVNEVVCLLVQFLTYAAVGIASLAIMFAGLKYTTSAEDPEARNNAKNMVVYAVIGLLAVLVACPVVDYIIANTEITPFEDSCKCLISAASGGGGGGSSGGGGGSKDGGGGGVVTTSRGKDQTTTTRGINPATTTTQQLCQYYTECRNAQAQNLCNAAEIAGYNCCQTCHFCCS